MKNFETVKLTPGLYLVATPIGNLRDISLRALDTLGSADLILCEDTRVSGKLLQTYDIQTKKMIYNDHNASKQRGQIIEKLSSGASIALISDAGMPLISDPGYKLVRDCQELGINVTSVPGASASLMAIQLSGFPSDKFTFLGFLPPKTEARKKMLSPWSENICPLIIYESAGRLVQTLQDIREVLGNREVAVTRELTKIYEEVRRDRVDVLIAHYETEGAPKGEIVILVNGAEYKAPDEEELKRLLIEAMKKLSVKDAAQSVSEQTGISKKQLYELALSLKG